MMPELHRFTLPVAPAPLQTSGKRLVIVQGRPRFFKSAKASAYQSAIALHSSRHLPKVPHSIPLALSLTFILPRPQRIKAAGRVMAEKRPDLDNLVKGTQDALSDFWVDDSQIVLLVARKFHAAPGESPCIEVTISDMSGEF